VAGNNPEPQSRVGGTTTPEQHRGHHPLRHSTIPYLYYNRLSVDSCQSKISSSSEKWLIFCRRS
jgi:hypothetical protein